MAFIGNLLNPYGNHFKEDLFLKYFLENLVGYEDLKENIILKNFVNDNPKVTVEKTIRNEKNENIGRVDLWLESDNYIIAIEGKIEAKDNKGQLEKYNKYLKNQDKKYLLLYLTLKKDEEPINVNKDELVNFHLMNFEQDILDFIDNSINDENIKDNIQSTLLDYKDALIKYMYNYYLSFEYSYELIQEITKNKDNFTKYEKIKEYYYQNIEECKNTVIEDIAENFEYAKANIERLFLVELKDSYVDDNTFIKSNLSLDDNLSKDLYLINKARSERINLLGNISMTFSNEDDLIKIDNDFFGLKVNAIDEKNIDNKEFIKLESSIFKSDNISKLLDKNYREKLIHKVLN